MKRGVRQVDLVLTTRGSQHRQAQPTGHHGCLVDQGGLSHARVAGQEQTAPRLSPAGDEVREKELFRCAPYQSARTVVDGVFLCHCLHPSPVVGPGVTRDFNAFPLRLARLAEGPLTGR
ncbi:hypothetical protein GCM10009798_08400 [Nocardioides panacihumi]|uniref:Uncharacterized protein n=1 Tax=Nocardioides panacihumi TaxID=400774 RepID=A0ABN2QFS1_9ACTN